MNKLQVGFSRLDVTPSLGLPISGYFHRRDVEGILDPLEVCAITLQVEDTKVIMLSFDNCHVPTKECKIIRQAISEATGVPYDAIFIHSTHNHTSPYILSDAEAAAAFGEDKVEPLLEYFRFIKGRMVDAAVYALADCQPAKMGWAIGNAPNIAFVRRFRMKDGKIRTNPGVGNPDILHPIGDVDERLNVLRFDREKDTVVLTNFGNHPDVVGGNLASCDWPGFLRRRVEKALDNVKCIFFNGMQGDVNHVNVKATGGDFNDMFNDFDDVARGYGHARHMGNVMAGAVLQVYDKVNYVDVDSLRYIQTIASMPSNMPDPEDLPLARKYNDLHNAGRDDLIPYEGMELTTVVAEAGRMIRLEHGPESFEMGLGALALGNVAFIAVPGEPFTGIGRGLKLAEGWDVVLPMCLTNGSEGYFPMREAYDEGGYEARSSRFKAGVAERIIAEGTALLDQLR